MNGISTKHWLIQSDNEGIVLRSRHVSEAGRVTHRFKGKYRDAKSLLDAVVFHSAMEVLSVPVAIEEFQELLNDLIDEIYIALDMKQRIPLWPHTETNNED